MGSDFMRQMMAYDRAISPQILNDSAATSPAWLPLDVWRRIVFGVITGAIAAGGALAVVFEQAKNASGGGAKPISGQTLAFTDEEEDSIKTIELVASEHLDATNGYNHVRMTITETETQDAYVCGFANRGGGRYGGSGLNT